MTENKKQEPRKPYQVRGHWRQGPVGLIFVQPYWVGVEAPTEKV